MRRLIASADSITSRPIRGRALTGRTVGTTRIINAGSIGASFQGAGAYWLLLGSTVQLRRTYYDVQAAAKRVRATSYPQAEQFASTSILEPPTEEATLKLFASAALK